MRRLIFAVLLLVLSASWSAPRARAAGEFAGFSRSWYAHLVHVVVAEDGTAIALYARFGCASCPADSITYAFDAVSEDGATAYGSVIATSDPERWPIGDPVSLTLQSPASALLQETGIDMLICSDGWRSEVPQPHCSA